MGLNADFATASFTQAHDVTPMRLSHTFDGAVLNLDAKATEATSDITISMNSPGLT